MSASQDLNTPTEQSAGSTRQEDDIQIGEILAYLFDAKWTILSITAAALIIAAFQASKAVPIYRTDALLQIERQDQSLPGLNSATQVFSGASSSQSVVDLIKSRRVIGEAIDRLNIINHVALRYYPYFGSAMARRYHGEGVAEPFLGLDEYAWGGEVLTLDHFDITGELGEDFSVWKLIPGENQDYILMNGEQKILSGIVGKSVTADYQGSKIEIHVSDLAARPGVPFTISRSSKNSAIQGLKGRVLVHQAGGEYSRTGIVTVSMQGSDPQSIVNIVNAVTGAYVNVSREKQAKEAKHKLSFINSQLPSLKEKQDQAVLELQKFQREVGSINITIEIENAQSQLEELKRERAVLRLQKEELQQKYNKAHPKLKSLARKIEILEEDKGKLEQNLRDLPEKEWVYLQKKSDVAASTELYMSMLKAGQELNISKAGMVGNVWIIDPAVIQPGSVKGKRTTLFIGLISGLLLGIVWVLLRRMMHRGVEDPARIERETGLPVFATIPHSDNQQKIISRIKRSRMRKSHGKPLLLANEYDTDMTIEALRSFRTNMRFALKTAENNVVIITGPSPGIGKSFFSSNYAAVSCRAGQRVLLIDADMRKGGLHQAMGSAKFPGLSDVIAGGVTLDEAVHELNDNYYFLSCGKRPPNPSELLETEMFQNLLEEVNQSFDLVIIDTPPILAVTDASIIAQYGGKLFVLLRSGQHTISEILAATSRFEKSGVKVTGILINDQEVQSSGYGYSYHYKYQ